MLKTTIRSNQACFNIAVNALSRKYNYTQAHLHIIKSSSVGSLLCHGQFYQKLFLYQNPQIVKPFSINFKSMRLLVKIPSQICAAAHFQEQSISFTVYGQRARIYIKNRQTSREKIDCILFPAGREKGVRVR